MLQPALSRRTLLLALATLLAVLAGVAAAPAAAAPGGTTLRGTYQLVAADVDVPEGDPFVHDYRHVLVAGDRTYDLELRGRPPRGGTPVEVRGTLSGRRVQVEALAETGEPEPAPTTVSAQGTPVTTRVLAVLVHWGSPDAVTPASAAAQLFGTSSSWYREVSYGQLSQAGDVAGWFRIAGPRDGLCYTNMQDIYTQGTAAAKAAGYDAAAYDRVVLYFPKSSNANCSGYAGWAYQPGKVVWLNGAMTTRTVTHEQGHNHGLGHAQAYACGSGVVLDSTCTTSEYGDPFDAMGASSYVAHFSAPLKDRMGWLAGRRVTLTGDGSAVLAPYERQEGAVQVAAVPVSSTRTYWLEHRQPIGVDARLPAGATGGVLVHLTDTQLPGVKLLDGSPDGSFSSAVLPAGSTWTTPEGVRISVGTPTSAGIPVARGSGSTTSPTAPSDGGTPTTGTTGPVTGLTAVGDASGRAVLRWTMPSGATGAEVRVAAGTTAPTRTSGTPVGRTSSSTLTAAGLAPGTTYTFSVFAQDGSGTWGPGTAVRVAGTALSGAASAAKVRTGSTVRITGALSRTDSGAPVPGAAVLLERSSTGSSWSVVASGTTTSTGSVSLAHAVPASGYYRLRFAGGPGLTTRTGASLTVRTFGR